MSAHASPDEPWWKSAVVYQVYPRSFADSDSDGVGDLRGILQRLDHIAELGADVVWLSPVYRSPQDDNGYDVSDYQDIDPLFGTLADLDALIEAVHARGMRLLMDLVVNHTSDEHAWFEESRSSRDNARADWYIWRDPRPGHVGGTPGAEPNNWGSIFSGSAWEWVPEREQYYLHLFSRKQPDLNWENTEVRAAVFSMMRWWLDRGVDGFRMDVVNLLSKPPGLADGPEGPDGYADVMPLCSYGPRIHDYLAEMRREVFGEHADRYLTVGEMPGVTPEQALRFTDVDDGQVHMVFQFEHVGLDHDGAKWNHRALDLRALKKSMARWQQALGQRGWNSLYWNNHDQPRAVSRWGDDTAYWRESATALATVLHLHRGTPYVYQGEEIGMTNVPFASTDDFRDIESLNHFRAATERGEDAEDVLASLRLMSRDNARTPMQWDSSPQAGFTDGDPWIPVNPNHEQVNAAAQRGEPGSIYEHYRALIRLRRTDPVVVHGDFTMLVPDNPTLYAYERRWKGQALQVWANLSSERVEAPMPEADDLVLGNVSGTSDGTLGPWEARVLRVW